MHGIPSLSCQRPDNEFGRAQLQEDGNAAFEHFPPHMEMEILVKIIIISLTQNYQHRMSWNYLPFSRQLLYFLWKNCWLPRLILLRRE